uniref:DZF domain-containing protein n=1 Tax=Gorilla gorilla gorilla TaxID=9595 RepID=A0A2I2YEU9_GORGO
ISIRSFANDDRHVMVKHSTIYPSPEELEAVQNMVSTVECALKHVSDWLDETNKGTKTEGETEVKKDEAGENYSKWSDIVWCNEDWPGCKRLAD